MQSKHYTTSQYLSGTGKPIIKTIKQSTRSASGNTSQIGKISVRVQLKPRFSTALTAHCLWKVSEKARLLRPRVAARDANLSRLVTPEWTESSRDSSGAWNEASRQNAGEGRGNGRGGIGRIQAIWVSPGSGSLTSFGLVL